MAHLEATAGISVPLTAAFTDSDGVAVAPDVAPTYKVYNRDYKLLSSTEPTNTGTGTYTYNYVPPKSLVSPVRPEVTLYAECTATVGGVASVGARHEITVKWAP